MILSKYQLVNNISSELSDNATQSITPYHVRHNLIDIIDSISELIKNEDIDSANFKTIDSRTSVFGEKSLERINLPNHSTEDNSAFGFSSLRINLDGKRNTAIGSYSLQSNSSGSDNVAIGVHSLAGNVTGSCNVGIGNYSLLSGRTGSFNIAIGHGAGYYVDKQDDYKFYLGSSPANDSTICTDTSGDNVTPLLKGDLLHNILGINTKIITEDAVLHVGGNAIPSTDSVFNLGSENLTWNKLYSNNLYLSSTEKFSKTPDSVSFNFPLIPESDNVYDFGSSSNRIRSLYAYDIIIDNSATINSAQFIYSSHYINKTLNLASKPEEIFFDGGGPYSLYDYALEKSSNLTQPYLTKDQVNGAGFSVYVDDPEDTDYHIVLDTQSTDSSFWKSNISIEVDESAHIGTSKINSLPEFDIYLKSGEINNVLSLKDNYLYFGDQNFLDNNDLGFGNYNFVFDGTTREFVTSFLVASPDSSKIAHRFFSNATGNQDISYGRLYEGFELEYENTLPSTVSSPDPTIIPGRTCFSIKSFSPSSNQIQSGNSARIPINQLVINRDSSSKIFAITDINNYAPEYTGDFNTSEDCTIRINSRGNNKVSKILLETNNRGDAQIVCDNALEFSYSGVKSASFNDQSFDLFNSTSGTHNFMINMGDYYRQDVSIGMRHVAEDPVAASGYGAIYVNAKAGGELQSSTLMFIDSSGNKFDLVRSPSNSIDGFLFIDDDNTFGGFNSFDNKSDVQCEHNTGVGFESSKDITTGSKNTLYGSQAGKALTTGSNNLAIGYGSLNKSTTNSYNVCVGTDSMGSNINSDYNFLLGVNDDLVLMSGVLGPNNSNKFLQLPNDGKLIISNESNTESVSITSNSIEIVDRGGADLPESDFNFTFTGNNSSTLLVLNHSEPRIIKDHFYANKNQPFAELKGDLKILGSVLFSDGSELSSSTSIDEISTISNKVTDNENKIASIFVEGFAIDDIDKPSSYNNPSIGNIRTPDGNVVQIHHRDTSLVIKKDAYVIAAKINSEYRPIRISKEESLTFCG